MTGRKILMLTGEFSEAYEIVVSRQGMAAVGHAVHVACPERKALQMIETSLHDGAGGRGPEYSRIRPRVQAIVRAFHAAGELASAEAWPGLAAFERDCPKAPGTEVRHA